jgi:hypothetical protein
MSEEAKRIEEIREAVEWGKKRFPVVDEFSMGQIVNLEDVECLLKRVEELDVANLKLERDVHRQAGMMIEVAEENERLKYKLEKKEQQLAEIQSGGEWWARRQG